MVQQYSRNAIAENRRVRLLEEVHNTWFNGDTPWPPIVGQATGLGFLPCHWESCSQRCAFQTTVEMAVMSALAQDDSEKELIKAILDRLEGPIDDQKEKTKLEV